jgi:hypothetical protein
MRSKRLLLVVSALCFLAAAGLLAWTLWPGPAATTADDVVVAMKASDPATLPRHEADRWVRRVVTTIERLPPQEFQRLFQRAVGDEVLQRRFAALGPEQQQKLALLIPEEQFARLVVEMSVPMVQFCKSLPRPLRRGAVRHVHALSVRHAQARKASGRPEMSREDFARWQKATTPRQRAEFIRSMREMRKLLQEARSDR